MANTTEYKLLFHPVNVTYVPDDWQKIKVDLRAIGFIGGEVNEEDQSYYVGEQFLQRIIFLGCSPQIQLAPEVGEGDKFCRIQFSQLNNRVQFKSFDRDVQARCPHCRQKIQSWKMYVEQWQETSENLSISCDNCQKMTTLYALNWRHNAAFVSCFIEVFHIYPHEAIPADDLLTSLERMTGQTWDYCYINNNSTL